MTWHRRRPLRVHTPEGVLAALAERTRSMLAQVAFEIAALHDRGSRHGGRHRREDLAGPPCLTPFARGEHGVGLDRGGARWDWRQLCRNENRRGVGWTGRARV